ncbi:hypothetical protein ACPPVO_36080 [Dactylosporangium sp. McL0621]
MTRSQHNGRRRRPEDQSTRLLSAAVTGLLAGLTRAAADWLLHLFTNR